MGRPGGSSCQGVEAEGGPGREVVTLRCCGLSEGKDGMDGKEGGGDGRKGKGTPKEERDAPTEKWNLGSSQAGREEEEEDGGSLAKLEGGKENWDITGETPTGEALGQMQSQGWAAGQGARSCVRAQSAQGGAAQEHPNRKGCIPRNQRGFFRMFRVAAKCPELAHHGSLKSPFHP